MRTAGIAAAGAALLPSFAYGMAPVGRDRIRVGLIATGLRGQNHLE
ncbi:MAG: hypothetical protein RL429_747, partial [Bacteroidota bacterium]